MVKKNEIYNVKILDMSYLGLGVAKVNDFVVFIENTLSDDFCEIKIVKVEKRHAFGKLLNVIKSSPNREQNPQNICPVYDKCGGCSLLHMSYPSQLEYKRNEFDHKYPISYNETPYNYRNKVIYPVREQNGETKIGFFRKNSHIIVESPTCVIGQPVFKDIIHLIKNLMPIYKITPYNEEKHRGLLRNIFIRQGKEQIMIGLVFNHKSYKPPQEFVDKLSKIPNVTSILINYNDKITNVALGDKTEVLYGNNYIIDSIGHVDFKISLNSFFQINKEQCKKLYDDIINFAGFTGKEHVIDAYCGIGTISLYISNRVEHVYGIEVVPQAIEDAKQNAKNIENVSFLCGQVEDVIMSMVHKKINTIIVDPPRSGVSLPIINAIKKILPDKIIYVSCNTKNLKRDISLLADKYEVSNAKLYDFFPHSIHVESLFLLTKHRMD